jgi:hypothetical protein
MKPNAHPAQRPPIVEPCPWCDGSLEIGDASVACWDCHVEIPMAADHPLEAAA